VFRPYDGFAAWARWRLPARAVVGNLFLSDFPMLFYSAPEFRYLLGLDPMFGYRHRPEEVARLEKFRRAELDLPPAELARVIGTRWAFASVHGAALADILKRRGFRAAYEGPDGWVFDLEEIEERR